VSLHELVDAVGYRMFALQRENTTATASQQASVAGGNEGSAGLVAELLKWKGSALRHNGE
jgi:hypothetical protein